MNWRAQSTVVRGLRSTSERAPARRASSGPARMPMNRQRPSFVSAVSVGVAAAAALDLAAPFLLGDAPLHRASRRPGLSPRYGRRRDGLGHQRYEARLGRLPVAKLGSVLRRRDRQHPAHQTAPQPFDPRLPDARPRPPGGRRRARRRRGPGRPDDTGREGRRHGPRRLRRVRGRADVRPGQGGAGAPAP